MNRDIICSAETSADVQCIVAALKEIAPMFNGNLIIQINTGTVFHTIGNDNATITNYGGYKL